MQSQLKPIDTKVVPASQYPDQEEATEQFKQETVIRWGEYRSTGKTVPNDDVLKWLESWVTDAEGRTECQSLNQ